jgi:hypothetical protein
MPNDEYDDEYEYDDRDPIEVLTDRLMEDPRAQQVFERARGVLDRLGFAIDRVGKPKPRPPRPPRPRQRIQRPPAAPKPDPRVVLGFPPSLALTRQIIKERQRQLSQFFHPDRGGNKKTMQRINTAADELLAALL